MSTLRSRLGGALAYLLQAALWSGLGALGALIITGHIELGSKTEEEDDDDRVRWSDVFWARQGPPRTIYLHRGPIVLSAGVDAAHENRSSVVFSGGLPQASLPGFNGSNKTWTSIVDCVKRQFAPFAVEVTDERPQGPGYVMAVVGGRPSDVGVAKKNITGLAPFNGTVVPDAVVFAFSAALGNRPRAICEVLTMEVAHAYGLDHGYHCPDVMSYLSDCGNKTFIDKDVPCGEHKARACSGGQPTQNSWKRLLAALGPRGKPSAAAVLPAPPAGPVAPVGHEHDHEGHEH